MDHVSYKYHPNIWKLDIFQRAHGKNLPFCQCCGLPTEYFLDFMYTTEDVSCVCPTCVASGKAAKKFNGSYIAHAEQLVPRDEEKDYALFCCTPGYYSWQDNYWLACCNDYCAFIDYVGKTELDELGIGEEAFSEEDKEYRKVLTKFGSPRGYLFQCLHCKSYRVGVDFD